MSAYTDPSVDDFKVYFVRDFPYGATVASVMDADITKALNDSSINLNPNLFDSQGIYTVGFLNLAAHFLVLNLRASSQGIAGQYTWLQSSKSVGSVNESFNIPQRILDNPEFAMLSKTTYGAKYLYMVLPQLSGQAFTVAGRTHA